MITKCLSCDWDFSENPNDRADGGTSSYFCQWCSEGETVCITKAQALEKLSGILKNSGEIDIQKAFSGLNNLNATWAPN